MRPIKFRQPVVLSNGHFERWHYWGFYEDGVFHGPLTDLESKSEQFTGLLDKNGKEIYEGDIVQFGKYTSEVTYSETDFCHIIEREEGEYYSLPFLKGYREFELIGNIYENPELLEDE